MFEKLIEVLSAIAAELKRSNDGRGIAANTPAPQFVPATPAPKAEAKPKAAPKAEKPAAPAPAAEPMPVYADVQAQCVAFLAEHPRKREALLEVFKSCGVPATEANGVNAMRISNAKDDPAKLKAVSDALTAALEAVAV